MKISRKFTLFLGATALIGAAFSTQRFVYGAGNTESQLQAASSELRWPPPSLSNPITLYARAGGGDMELANGTKVPNLSITQDYVIQLPTNAKRVGSVYIKGGRNVRLIGGEITVPANDSLKRAIYIKDSTGTVHVEGVLINNTAGPDKVAFDGVAIDAPDADVQLQNMRIVGLTGSLGGFHSDVVQPWGGVNQLRIDRLTGFSDYQGLQLAPDLHDNDPIGSAIIQNVNLRYVRRTSGDYGYLVWLTRGKTTCKTYPIALTEVYAESRPNPTNSNVGNSAWPKANSTETTGCTGVLNGSKTEMQWTGLKRANGTTSLTLGGQRRVKTWTTGMGDFVSTNVGIGYSSPGYQPPNSSAVSSPSATGS